MRLLLTQHSQLGNADAALTANERTLSRSAEDLEAGPPDQQAEVRGRESALDETHAQHNAVQTGPSESKENEVVDKEFASVLEQPPLPLRIISPTAANPVPITQSSVPGPRDRDDGR